MRKPLAWMAEVAVAVTAVVMTVLWSWRYQHPLTVASGRGWDGVEYSSMVEQCWRGHVAAKAPFVYRLGTPCLAALFSAEPVHGLLLVNEVASMLAVALLGVYLARHVQDWRVRSALLVSYVLCWLGPLRHAWWGPAESIDSCFHVFFIAGLLALESRRRELYLPAIIFVGALFREAMLVFPLALAATEWPNLRRTIRALLPGSAAGALAWSITHLVGRTTNTYGFLGTAFYWAEVKGPAMYLHALFISFGPLLAIVVACPEPARRWLSGRRDLMLLVSCLGFLAWIGGSDTERFMFWLAPIFLTAVGRTLSTMSLRTQALPLVSLVALQVLSERVGVATPDSWLDAPRAWPLLTPLRAQGNRLLLSCNADFGMGAVAVLQYLVVIGGLAWWMRASRTSSLAPVVERS